MVPYDRTLLSKALPVIDARKKPLRPAEFLNEANIDYVLNSTVAGINRTAKKITLASGEVI
jgi:NAD(P)H-nitrite reductase large subunit